MRKRDSSRRWRGGGPRQEGKQEANLGREQDRRSACRVSFQGLLDVPPVGGQIAREIPGKGADEQELQWGTAYREPVRESDKAEKGG